MLVVFQNLFRGLEVLINHHLSLLQMQDYLSVLLITSLDLEQMGCQNPIISMLEEINACTVSRL